jgi:thioredoxin 1
MATVALTKETFEQTVQDNDTVIVDFWAEWCGPCRSFAPTFEAASEEHTDIVFGKVDTEDQQELAQAFGIRSIPTLMVFRDQVILYAQPGALPGNLLEDLIGQVKALDMDEVRTQIAAQNDEAGEESTQSAQESVE